jgi:hypothetical protein
MKWLIFGTPKQVLPLRGRMTTSRGKLNVLSIGKLAANSRTCGEAMAERQRCYRDGTNAVAGLSCLVLGEGLEETVVEVHALVEG